MSYCSRRRSVCRSNAGASSATNAPARLRNWGCVESARRRNTFWSTDCCGRGGGVAWVGESHTQRCMYNDNTNDGVCLVPELCGQGGAWWASPNKLEAAAVVSRPWHGSCPHAYRRSRVWCQATQGRGWQHNGGCELKHGHLNANHQPARKLTDFKMAAAPRPELPTERCASTRAIGPSAPRFDLDLPRLLVALCACR